MGTLVNAWRITSSYHQPYHPVLELMESRCGQTTTIFCSQFTAEGWLEHLSSGALADSILDCIGPIGLYDDH